MPSAEVIHLSAGRELRVQVAGTAATLALWQPAEGGQASLGEASLDPQSLRRVIAALKTVLWHCERAVATQEA